MAHVPTPGDLATDLARSRENDTDKNDYWYINALKIFPIACSELSSEERDKIKAMLLKIGDKKFSRNKRSKILTECIEMLGKITMEFLTGKRKTMNEYFLTHRI